MDQRAPRLTLLAAFATVYLVWGSTYLAIRFAVETIPPFLMAGCRFLIAGLLLYSWARWRTGERPSSRHWRNAAVVGGLMLLGGNGLVCWAEQSVPSGLAALIVATVPLWMVLLEWARRGGTAPDRFTVVGLVIGFAGVAVLGGGEGGLESDRVAWAPAGVLLFASASWAAGSLYARYAVSSRSPVLATATQMLAGGAILLGTAVATGELRDFEVAAVSSRSIYGLAYLVVFGSIVAFTAYVWLLRATTPARVSTYAYVNPIVAVLLGWSLAGESLTPRIGIAAVLVVAAVIAVVAGRSPATRPPR